MKPETGRAGAQRLKGVFFVLVGLLVKIIKEQS
jgi:hypothetical protein